MKLWKSSMQRFKLRYSTDAAIEEILRRGKQIRAKKENRTTRVLFTGMFSLFIALVAVISFLSNTGAEPTPTFYGSFVISNEVSPYVFTAVIAFFIGILTTILFKCFYKKKPKDKMNDCTNEQNGDQ